MVLRVGEEEVVFRLPEAMRYSLDRDNTCYSLDTTDIIVSEHVLGIPYKDLIKECFRDSQGIKWSDRRGKCHDPTRS